MLRINNDNSSNQRLAGQAFDALRNNPLLIRRCVGVAAALIGLGLMTVTWDGPHDPLLAQVIEPSAALNAPTAASPNAAAAAR